MAVPEDMITVAEAARRLGRSIEQVRRYLREGKLQGQRIGQQWFIDERSLGLLYRQGPPRLPRVRETALMEAPKVETKDRDRLITRELAAEIERLREEIRREHGTYDVVAMIRRAREQH